MAGLMAKMLVYPSVEKTVVNSVVQKALLTDDRLVELVKTMAEMLEVPQVVMLVVLKVAKWEYLMAEMMEHNLDWKLVEKMGKMKA